MTDQTMFDTVVAHLLTQNSVSVSTTGACVYRGPDNKKCAIGCIIPDEMYTVDLEGKEVNLLVNNPLFSVELTTYLSQFNLGLLVRLQQIHDAHNPSSWYTKLEKVAAHFDLNFNPPKLQSETA